MFDNRCTSDLERVASVLQKTGFTSYIDHTGWRSVFNVGPDELAIKNRPEAIGDRVQFGHWECGLVMFRKEFGKANAPPWLRVSTGLRSS